MFKSIIKRVYSSIPTESKAFVFESHGKPESVLKIKRYPLKLGGNEVLVKILAAPINPSDINIIEGTYPVKPIWKDSFGAIAGQEGVAEVIQVDGQVNDIAVGDWVIPIQQGFNTWQTYAVANRSNILKLPKIPNVSPISAGTISVNPPTAYRMIKDFVNLNQGDVIIQNSANSAVGQAVIQLSKEWGFKTVNIIRPREHGQSELINKLYDLGANLVVTEDQVRKVETADLLKQLGDAPRLAFNGVGGKSATNMARLLGEKATMVTYGGMSRDPVIIPTSLYIFKQLNCTGFWLNKWYRTHTEEERISIYKDLFELMSVGKFQEPIHEKMNFNQTEEELLKIIGGNVVGKRILIS
ncbi:hypothetical protein BC833DRAFT_526874 [Globomyces pollinis-pini]|nr:hypothetical protein BC833DRAFT_526874 [Globomyces pollinis-pini]